MGDHRGFIAPHLIRLSEHHLGGEAHFATAKLS